MMALRTSGVSDLPRMRGERRRVAADPAVREDMVAASEAECSAREVRSAFGIVSVDVTVAFGDESGMTAPARQGVVFGVLVVAVQRVPAASNA